MGRSQHILPAIANRLRISRGFDNVWYSDVHYAHLIQKDWVLSKNAWSLVNRASRSRPRQQLTLDQQLQHLQALRAARAKGEKVDVKAIAAAAVEKSNAGKALGMAGCDYPNLRVSRVFTQHLPYKSIVSTFAYSVPEAGPQSKYGESWVHAQAAGRHFPCSTPQLQNCTLHSLMLSS